MMWPHFPRRFMSCTQSFLLFFVYGTSVACPHACLQRATHPLTRMESDDNSLMCVTLMIHTNGSHLYSLFNESLVITLMIQYTQPALPQAALKCQQNQWSVMRHPLQTIL